MKTPEKRPSVLLADDSALIRELVLQGLEESRFFGPVTVVEDGASAVATYFGTKHDLVIMDVMMPVMDGLEALKRIMAHDPRARVVMFTSIQDDALVERATSTGALTLIPKDKGIPALIEILRHAWNAGC
jgi:two-component system chemotaxis response regulator CheY